MNWLRQEKRDSEFAAIRKVFEFRKKAASAALRVNLNIENIEDLFSLAAASGRYPLEESVSTAIAATLDYSRRTGQLQCFNIEADNSFHIPSSWTAENEGDGTAKLYKNVPSNVLYAGLLSGKTCSPSNSMKNTIITLNYDTLLEEALAHWKIPFWYGFKPRTVEYDDSSKWARGEGDDALTILKLHGSLNWAKPKRARGRLNVYGSYSDVLKVNGRVVLIPPTWRKSFQGSSERGLGYRN